MAYFSTMKRFKVFEMCLKVDCHTHSGGTRQILPKLAQKDILGLCNLFVNFTNTKVVSWLLKKNPKYGRQIMD